MVSNWNHAFEAAEKVNAIEIEKVTTPDHYHRIRVGRSIDGFGLSPGITKEQRLEVEGLMKKAFAKMTGDLAGLSYTLKVRNRNL